jgi:ABC-type bacteriocin/lantibiotic exporter with double-glycine peptidase domain
MSRLRQLSTVSEFLSSEIITIDIDLLCGIEQE